MIIMVIPHSKPTIDISDAIAGFDIIYSGELADGDKVWEFEDGMKIYTSRGYAKCTSSGTTAIQIGLRAQNIGYGDEVVIPSYACYSIVSAVDATGARPVFADVGDMTPNITRETVEKKVTDRTKAIIAPHMFGILAGIEDIQDLGVPIIEDCAQSIGGLDVGSKGEISILSFYATKIMACGRGGMILTDNVFLDQRVRDLMRYDGRERAGECYNFSMTNIEAAIGCSQLRKLDEFIDKRGMIGDMYDTILSYYGLDDLIINRPKGSIVGRYVVRLPKDMNLDGIIEKMYSNGIDCRKPIYRPLHTYFGLEDFPNTDDAYSRDLSLPAYPSLDMDKVSYIGNKLVEIIKN